MWRKTAIAALVALLGCAAFSESHPKYGWRERPTEKFDLSNRAKRKLSLMTSPIGVSDSAMIKLRLTSQFPVKLSVQNARGDSVGDCYYGEVTDVTTNCSMRWDKMPKYVVVEDANQAGLTQKAKWADALNRVTLTISDYTCVKHCPKFQ
jgi:hypothetical protein